MKNTKSTKRALLSAILALVMTVSMLVGTTFAWFTDSVTSSGNKIVAGELDVELHMFNAASGKYENISDATKPIFGADGLVDTQEDVSTIWEPGKTQVVYLAIKNAGDLDLKYKVVLDVTNIEKDLNKVLSYTITPDAKAPEGKLTAWNGTDAKSVKLGEQVVSAPNVALEAEAIHYFALSVHMDELAGNEYMNGSITFDLSVLAAQLASEDDSFGPSYDGGAIYSEHTSNPSVLPDASAGESAAESLELKSGAGLKVVLDKETVNDIATDASSVAFGHTEAVLTQDTNGNNAIYIEDAALYDENGDEIDLSDNTKPITVTLPAQDVFAPRNKVLIYHDGELIADVSVNDDTTITYTTTHFCEIVISAAGDAVVAVNGVLYNSIEDAFAAVESGSTVKLLSGINTTEKPLTETIVVDKEITLDPNGMYLVSSAPATFTVAEGGKLTVAEGSFTIKNTATEGAAVLLDGGEFVMAGGSFDAHTAVRTTAGKSSVATLAAGWSNRVTIGFDLQGNDTLNVTGGSLYTGKDAVKTASGTHTTINMSGGLLSSGATQYTAAVCLNGTAEVNITGGTIASTYQSGLNGSAAIEANVAPTTINVSGDAKLTGKGWGITLGSHWSSPAVLDERFTLNVSGNAEISATGDTGFGIRYCQDAVDVVLSENAKVSGKFHAVQMNSNSYVFANSTLLIKDNVTISSTAGRYGGGYGVAAYGNVTILGGSIYGSTNGVACFGGNLIIDNSESGSAIKITGGKALDVGAGASLIINGTPEIAGYTMPTFVGNADDLAAALAAGASTYLVGDVTLNDQVSLNGGSLNGNGSTITVDKSASSNYNIDDCVISTTGGTVSNVNIVGNPNNTRAIGSGSTGDIVLTSELVIDAVRINKVQYAINGSGATGNETVTVKNSTLYGWISFSNIKSFSFNNCVLGMGDSYDGYMVVYGNTTFNNCNFEGVFDLGARIGDDGKVCGAGSTITISNCYYDGVKITAENFVEYFFYGPGDERDFGNLMANYTIKVDGVTVDNSAYVNA